MTKFLHKINKHENYSNNVNEDHQFNITLCEDEYHLHYDKYDPYNGHEYVDLGLPSGLKWCTHNVGASTLEEEGFFFSWGNVEGHNLNGTGSYDFGTGNTTEPYKSSSGATLTGNIAVGDAYDMVRANMGGNWRLPTNTEFQELYDNTDSEWTTINGVNGYKFMKKADHSIYVFFPAAGVYINSSHNRKDSIGYYWSSVLYSAVTAYKLYFNDDGVVYPQSNDDRYLGFSVRGVAD